MVPETESHDPTSADGRPSRKELEDTLSSLLCEVRSLPPDSTVELCPEELETQRWLASETLTEWFCPGWKSHLESARHFGLKIPPEIDELYVLFERIFAVLDTDTGQWKPIEVTIDELLYYFYDKSQRPPHEILSFSLSTLATILEKDWRRHLREHETSSQPDTNLDERWQSFTYLGIDINESLNRVRRIPYGEVQLQPMRFRFFRKVMERESEHTTQEQLTSVWTSVGRDTNNTLIDTTRNHVNKAIKPLRLHIEASRGTGSRLIHLEASDQ